MSDDVDGDDAETLAASVDSVRVAGTSEGAMPVVVLTFEGRCDVLPIFIAFEEAMSIARGLEAEDIGRPLTHDLTLDVMEELGGRVERVVVSDVEEGTYIADLHVATPRGEVTVDARPSDSLALAVRTNAPVGVAPHVYEYGRREPEEFDDLDDIREVTSA